MTALKNSQTTENLLSKLNLLKEQKHSLTDKIKDKIQKNNQILEQRYSVNNKFNQKMLINKERSLQFMEKRLKHKLVAEKKTDLVLNKAVEQNQSKRAEIQRRIQEIKNKNLMRIGQLNEIEQKVIRKLTDDLKKNQMREKSLKEEYKRIKMEQQKVFDTKKQQKKEIRQQWQILKQQKWRLQQYIRENQQRQALLVQKRNPVPLRKQEKKKSQQKYIPNEKQYNKLKTPDNANSKLMGNQYLEHIKLIHKQHLVNKNKKKLMNLNLKVINYNPEIMDRILRSTSDLSKIPRKTIVDKKQPQLEIKDEIKTQVKSEHPRCKSQFFLRQDQQTQKYLVKIKSNLKQLQRIKDQQKTQLKGQNLQSQKARQQQLLLPATLQKTL